MVGLGENKEVHRIVLVVAHHFGGLLCKADWNYRVAASLGDENGNSDGRAPWVVFFQEPAQSPVVQQMRWYDLIRLKISIGLLDAGYALALEYSDTTHSSWSEHVV